MQLEEELYTPTQAARILNLHPRTVHRYIHSGYIDASLSPTGRFYIPASSIEKYLDACRTRARKLLLFN